MKLIISIIILFSFSVIINGCNKTEDNPSEPTQPETSIVSYFGQPRIVGKNLVDKNGDILLLRGMSLFWSQWGGDYYNRETITWLRDDWKCTVVRAAIGVENGGYLSNPQDEYQKIKNVIEVCIDLDIYVIVDWHDHHAEDHVEEAKSFFELISANYGNYPNIIYEIYNEPLDVSWSNVIKPYADSVISTIRANDPDNIIVVGTRNWSQDVEDVISNPIRGSNIAYSFHFYSSTHKQLFRNKAALAINAGIPLFVTEWGMSEADGNGIIDNTSLVEWADFMQANNLSWCNWSISNKNETSAAMLPTTIKLSGWSENELSESGRIIRNYIISLNSKFFDYLKIE